MDIAKIRKSIITWLNTVKNEHGLYKYNHHALRPYSVESTTAAIAILKELGELENMSSESQQKKIEALQNFQDSDGGFRDPLIKEHDLLDNNPGWKKINEHIAGACLQTLAMLDSKPLYHGAYSSPIYNWAELDPVTFIPSLDHLQCPWGRCHNVSFSLLAYRREHGLYTKEDKKTQLCYEMIESEMLGSTDGMPGAKDHPIGRRIAGYYMLTFCYLAFDKALPNPEKAIDMILYSVSPSGEVGEGGMCLNWDAVYTLNSVCAATKWNYRYKEVRETIGRITEFLIDVHSKPDGGFSFFPDYCIEEHNGVRVSLPVPESDVQGTLMCLTSLNIIDAIKEKIRYKTFLDSWLKSKE